jgi:hypothetical protein
MWIRMGKRKNYDVGKIRKLSDGVRCSREIAAAVGCPQKYVQRIQKKENLPRPKQGGPSGQANGFYKGGRSIDLDGYVTVPAPEGHPYAKAKARGRRNLGRILEHRLVMERVLGRYLEPHEVVDHRDGCTIHNHPDNLRVFSSNAEHLQATITGQVPNWSAEGRSHFLGKGNRLPEGSKRVDSYGQRKKRGDVRLQQILRARELLGKDSPYLLGTERYLKTTETRSHSKTDSE